MQQVRSHAQTRATVTPVTWVALALACAALAAGCEEDKPRYAALCGVGSECPAGERCVEGFCVSSCEIDADCPGQLICVSEQCVEACIADADCLTDDPPMQVCQEGACIVLPEPGRIDAGGDLAANEFQTVTLDASESHEVYPGTVTYTWTLTGSNPPGIEVAFADAKTDTTASSLSPIAKFTAPAVVEDTTLSFSLEMRSSEGQALTDQVTVLVSNTVNEVPVVQLEASVPTCTVGEEVVVSAEGTYDPNPKKPGDPDLTYTWSSEGLKVVLTDGPTELGPLGRSFICPLTNLEGKVDVRLAVFDGQDTTIGVTRVIVAPPTSDKCDPPSCDDGNACTADQCIAGSCKHTAIDVSKCDDGNVCTTDDCDPSSGCVSTPNTAPCDDHNVCTTDDVCKAGACTGGSPNPCDDGEVCTTDSCDAEVGCAHAANALPCSDGDFCTTNDVCALGMCAAGNALNCDDGNACTTDVCKPESGCVYTPNEGPCEDTDPCTDTGLCKGVVCLLPDKVCPDDGDPCTDDVCDPGSGECGVPIEDGGACEDGLPCTVFEVCVEGSCEGDPFEPCTDPSAKTLCVLSGPKGAIRSCDIRVAKSTSTQAGATELFAEVVYGPELALLDFTDGLDCSGGAGCVPYTLPEPFQTLQTGHPASFLPDTPAMWSGGGSFTIAPHPEGSAPLNTAYVVGAATVGNPHVITARFELLSDVSPDTPVTVNATELVLTSSGAPLATTVLDTLIRTSPAAN
jgi:hypothetical protein